MQVHFEPYLYLAALTHKSVLVAWGGFYFRVADRKGEWKIVDDADLDRVHPPRKSTIGASSEPYGHAKVEVMTLAGDIVCIGETQTVNHVWVAGLEADTEYRYRVTVGGHEWAPGVRRDWIVGEKDGEQGLAEIGRAYDNRFRTLPRPEVDADLTFAALGDFGTGVRHASTEGRRQREVAHALEQAVDREGVRMLLTTGDNIYAGRTLLGIPAFATGDEDDDWFFTFYQPYRYVINRIPVYPSVGNHDGQETEMNDDRDQLLDNFYLVQRLEGEEAAGRASLNPGLFYKFRWGSGIEFVCVDSSRRSFLFGQRFFRHPNHLPFLQSAFPADHATAPNAPRWRIPYAHHPPYCAGPLWGNSKSSIEHLVPLYQRAGVKLVLSGHEHNYQYSFADGIHYVVTGGGGKIRHDPPDKFEEAHTVAWASAVHFLLVKVTASEMVVTPIGESGEPLTVKARDGSPTTPVIRIAAPA